MYMADIFLKSSIFKLNQSALTNNLPITLPNRRSVNGGRNNALISAPWQAPLEHRVRIFRFRRDYLKHVPVLDDLSIGVKPKYIDACPVTICVCRPHLVAVQHNVIAFRNDTLEGDVLSWVFPGHALEILDKRLFAIRYVRVVLGVGRSRVAFNRFARLALIEHHVVEVHDRFLVSFQSRHG